MSLSRGLSRTLGGYCPSWMCLDGNVQTREFLICKIVHTYRATVIAIADPNREKKTAQRNILNMRPPPIDNKVG